MKISEKVKKLTFKAQELSYPESDDSYFVTLSICPMTNEYGFQVWFDKWKLEGTQAKHQGLFLGFVEEATLTEALNSLEQNLDTFTESLEDNKEDEVPEIIEHNGRKYRLV